jgi:hypothetical protein
MSVFIYCCYTVPLYVSIFIGHHQMDSKLINIESLNCKLTVNEFL